MGEQICGIVIDRINPVNQAGNIQKPAIEYSICKFDLPGSSELLIGFHNNCTLIFFGIDLAGELFDENRGIAELTAVEEILMRLYPRSSILIMALMDITNFTGYTLFDNGKKRRSKAVINNEVMIDLGELTDYEEAHFKKLPLILPEIKRVLEKAYLGVINTKKRYMMVWEKHQELQRNRKRSFLVKFARNLINKNSKIREELNYTDGSLDRAFIEYEFRRTVSIGWEELQNVNFTVFKDVDADSLKNINDFIQISVRNLLKVK